MASQHSSGFYWLISDLQFPPHPMRLLLVLASFGLFSVPSASSGLRNRNGNAPRDVALESVQRPAGYTQLGHFWIVTADSDPCGSQICPPAYSDCSWGACKLLYFSRSPSSTILWWHRIDRRFHYRARRSDPARHSSLVSWARVHEAALRKSLVWTKFYPVSNEGGISTRFKTFRFILLLVMSSMIGSL